MSNTIQTEEVVKAILQRKQQFIDGYRQADTSDNVTRRSEDEWIFNHVCTVLDHAAKIMERPDGDFQGDHSMFMS